MNIKELVGKKWFWIATAIIALLVIGATVKFLPDPYGSGDPVTFFEWVYREVDEMLHGEKTP